MSAAHDEIVRTLPALLDGDLGDEARRSVGEHLEHCASCRRALEEIRAVVRAAGALGPLEPPRDLWPGIAERLAPRAAAAAAAAVGTAGTGALTTGAPARAGRSARSWRAPRITLPIPQLVAAALVLVTLSAGTGWWAATAPGAGGGGSGPGAPPGGPGAAQAAAPATTPELPGELARELEALEGVLEAGRSVLDPATVMVLERNLAMVERAIDESRRALEVDPASEFLEGHLTRAYERKLEYLREISRIVELAG